MKTGKEESPVKIYKDISVTGKPSRGLHLPRYLTRSQLDKELFGSLSPGLDIQCFYTGYRLPKTEREEGRRIFNVEHVVPRSFYKIQPDLIENDLHNMVVTLHLANTIRGNYIYDNVYRPSIILSGRNIWFANNHMKKMVDQTSFFYPKNMTIVSSPPNINATRIENADADVKSLRCEYGKCKIQPMNRGMVARIIFYFLIMHYPRIDADGQKYFRKNFLDDGRLLNIYMTWDETYPISSLEHTRNKLIYKIQGNTNPFVGVFEDGEYLSAERGMFRKMIMKCKRK